MKKQSIFPGKRAGKLLVIILLLSLGLFSLQINIYPPVAGKAGDSSVSSGSTGVARWGLEAVKAKNAWKITQGSEEVVVAVIDSGIDSTIPVLKDRMWKNRDEKPGDGVDNDNNGYVDDVSGWDFRDGDQLDDSGSSLFYHGTFVSGLLASNYDTKTGSGGVAPQVSLMDLRFLDSSGRFYTSDWNKLTDAINYAVENGADIINLSIYANIKPPKIVHDALKKAEAKGVLVVGIAGNEGRRVGYFGKWNEVFTVGSVAESGKVSDFSNYGPEVELVAPGSEVLSYKPGGNLATGSGTSFAAPHVAGTAALIVSSNPSIDLPELKRKLRKSARDIGTPGKDKATGYGIIDTDKSLENVRSKSPGSSPKGNSSKKVSLEEKVERSKFGEKRT
ncbi:MAG: S8 family serine peptidase [Candidatus Bipolaricaulia bacterium]